MEWDDEKVIKLIDLYHSKQVLWNPQNSNYKNRPKRYDALNEIATAIFTDLPEVERKIKNLTSHYYREKKKLDRLNKSREADDLYTSKWFAYNPLNFLRNKNMPTGSMDTDMLESHDSQSKQKDLPEILEQNTTSQPNKRPNTSPWKFRSSDPKKSNKMSCHRHEEEEERPKNNPKHEMESEALSILKHISQRQNKAREKDEDSLFGDYIASQLRKMDQSTKAIVRHRINNIIFEAETGYRADMFPDFLRPPSSHSHTEETAAISQ